MHKQLTPQLLETFLKKCRWFAGKAREVTTCAIDVSLPFGDAWVCIVEVTYKEGDNEYYQLPLSFQNHLPDNLPEQGLVAALPDGYLIDAMYTESFRNKIYEHIYTTEAVSEDASSLVFRKGKGLEENDQPAQIRSRVLPVDSSNSAMIFGERYFFKLYRKLFKETNPEVELVEFITENSPFRQIPAFCGSITWRRTDGTPDITLGMMQRMVDAKKDNWSMTGDYLNDFLYGVPLRVFSIKENVFEQVALLGQRTAEMHQALYAPEAEEAFAPEPFTTEYCKFLLRRINHLLESRYALLIDKYKDLDPATQHLAWKFMESKELIEEFTQGMLKRTLSSQRIRIHGDYHLGQVLSTDHDFIIIDFEGEPEASITERKIKHSPLKDVAGMIRSYHYAVSAKIFHSTETAGIDPQKLMKVTGRWYKLMKDTYLDAYMDTFGWPHPLFKDQSEINFLMLYYLLEKAVYELGYELSYRPDWVKIPLKGIVDVIREIEKLRGS
ncbi:maltokinase N-terminal cap-like domain-containing protein [Telluribacter sp.]|jgi:maltose alpha-D-glucosyltransferase/alpha-amylase|uniref:maltokinase N-terminal cap-like domain-containing protein n=1 Tax=Telluribacter sp. TaxID=1978767 RepID=UPI002E0E17B5|nr:phosphotransferase [Telluribacter sp.]